MSVFDDGVDPSIDRRRHRRVPALLIRHFTRHGIDGLLVVAFAGEVYPEQ
jgi:hypothetical protein